MARVLRGHQRGQVVGVDHAGAQSRNHAGSQAFQGCYMLLGMGDQREKCCWCSHLGFPCVPLRNIVAHKDWRKFFQ